MRFPARVLEYLRANLHYIPDDLRPGLGEAPPDAELARAYREGRLERDWVELQPHLPARADSVLDIGGGIGGLSLLLFRRYGPRTRLTLVEKKRRRQGGRDFPLLALAGDFLAANGVPRPRLALVDCGRPDGLRRGRYELVLSSRGLGYLFPYERYASVIRDRLAPGGNLILDVRRMRPTRRDAPELHAELERAGLPGAGAMLRRLRQDFVRVSVIAEGRYKFRVRAQGPR